MQKTPFSDVPKTKIYTHFTWHKRCHHLHVYETSSAKYVSLIWILFSPLKISEAQFNTSQLAENCQIIPCTYTLPRLVTSMRFDAHVPHSHYNHSLLFTPETTATTTKHFSFKFIHTLLFLNHFFFRIQISIDSLNDGTQHEYNHFRWNGIWAYALVLNSMHTQWHQSVLYLINSIRIYLNKYGIMWQHVKQKLSLAFVSSFCNFLIKFHGIFTFTITSITSDARNKRFSNEEIKQQIDEIFTLCERLQCNIRYSIYTENFKWSEWFAI